jgi:hypothetical protein
MGGVGQIKCRMADAPAGELSEQFPHEEAEGGARRAAGLTRPVPHNCAEPPLPSSPWRARRNLPATLKPLLRMLARMPVENISDEVDALIEELRHERDE